MHPSITEIHKMQELRLENAKLQEELTFKTQQIEVLCEAVRWLMESNAELRGFASELFRHWSSGPSRGCMLCEHEAKDCCCDCYYEEEAKRLGIEA